MKNLTLILILFYCLSVFIPDVFGAPMIYRVQQMQAMKKKQAQEEYEAEYQQEQQNQPGSQPQGQQLTPAETYQQSVDARNQAIAQAIVVANNSSVSVAVVPAGNYPSSNPSQGSNGNMMPSTGGDTVDLTEVWKKLDNKSTIWTALDDDQAKLLTVSEYIGRYEKEGVKINEPPAHYVQMIDQLSQQNPQMLQRPFGEVIQILAIIDYDFDNGMDRDTLAKKVLGDQGFAANQKRILDEQQAVQQQAGQQGNNH